jgi:hypothetical protein
MARRNHFMGSAKILPTNTRQGADIATLRLIFHITPAFDLRDMIAIQVHARTRAQKRRGKMTQITTTAKGRTCDLEILSSATEELSSEIIRYARAFGYQADRLPDRETTIVVTRA